MQQYLQITKPPASVEALRTAWSTRSYLMLNNHFNSPVPSPSTDSALHLQAAKFIEEIDDLLDYHAGQLTKTRTGFDNMFEVDLSKTELIIELIEYLVQSDYPDTDEIVKIHQFTKFYLADWFGLDINRHGDMIISPDNKV